METENRERDEVVADWANRVPEMSSPLTRYIPKDNNVALRSAGICRSYPTGRERCEADCDDASDLSMIFQAQMMRKKVGFSSEHCITSESIRTRERRDYLLTGRENKRVEAEKQPNGNDVELPGLSLSF